MPQPPPVLLVGDLPVSQEGGSSANLAAASAPCQCAPLAAGYDVVWWRGGTSTEISPWAPDVFSQPLALRRSTCGFHGPVAFAFTRSSHSCAMWCSTPTKKPRLRGPTVFALNCGCGAKCVFDPKGDVSFRDGCELCRYDRAELLTIANETFDQWREASESSAGHSYSRATRRLRPRSTSAAP